MACGILAFRCSKIEDGESINIHIKSWERVVGLQLNPERVQMFYHTYLYRKGGRGVVTGSYGVWDTSL